MTTKLEAPLKREIDIDGTPYTLTVAPDAMSLVLKGRRKGLELKWQDLVSGDAALTTALNASLTARFAPPTRPSDPSPAPPRKAKSRAKKR